MRVLAIDPGNETSGWVCVNGLDVHDSDPCTMNEVMQKVIVSHDVDLIACEFVQSYGMAVGKEVFHTCRWVGRYEQMAESLGIDFQLVYRSDVKMRLCRSMRAKDANIRQALLDMYPATGGGKKPQVGTVAAPGPLYGIKSHSWSALAIAVTVIEGGWSD